MNRILYIRDKKQAEQELQKINVSSGGIESMAPKMQTICLKLENVVVAAANILKQEMLSLGGDAAVARGVVNGTLPVSDVILIGNAMKLVKLTRKLKYQKFFGLPAISDDIMRLLDNIKGEACNEVTFCGKQLKLSETQIMGILNVTPDSFSDGNKYLQTTLAVQQAQTMIDAGAVIIDVGGESTRPGAEEVNTEEELKRTIGVIEAIGRQSDVLISIDTSKAEVARQAIEAGAGIINDISALRFDEQMIKVLQDNPQVGIILMHMQGKPRTMQSEPYYKDTVKEVIDFLQERIDFCLKNGIEKSKIMIDPGIGFGKRHEDNLLLLQRLAEFHCLGCPVVLGASRKSFINRISAAAPEEREEGTLATTALAHAAGVHLVRVHDVKKNSKMLAVLNAVRQV